MRRESRLLLENGRVSASSGTNDHEDLGDLDENRRDPQGGLELGSSRM